MDFPDGQNYGGNNYTKAIVNGYQGKTPIMIGTSSGVLQQPGNDMNNFGPTGIQTRYNAGTEVPNTSNPAVLSDINDPRVIVIPMVTAFNAGKSTTAPANITGFITALIVPDPLHSGQFYAVVVSTNETMTIASLDGPQTGTTKAVLLR